MIRARAPLFVINAGLAALCLVLLWQVHDETVRPLPALEAAAAIAHTSPGPRAHSTIERPTTRLPPLESLTETRHRPLFAEGRRPPVQAEAPEPVAAARALDAALLGVLVTADQRVAILRLAPGASTLRLTEGQLVDGWRVVAIARDHVLLQGDRIVRVPLHRADAASAARSLPRPAAYPAPTAATTPSTPPTVERRARARRASGSPGVSADPPRREPSATARP